MCYLLNCKSKLNIWKEKNKLIIQIVLKGLIIIFFFRPKFILYLTKGISWLKAYLKNTAFKAII